MIGKMISIEKLEEGMSIIKDIYSRGGGVIVPANTQVTSSVINLLARHSIQEVVIGEETSILDPFSENSEDTDILDGALGMLDYLESNI